MLGDLMGTLLDDVVENVEVRYVFHDRNGSVETLKDVCGIEVGSWERLVQ